MSPEFRQRLASVVRRPRSTTAREIRLASALAEVRLIATEAIAQLGKSGGEGSAALFQLAELAANAERRSRYRLPCDVRLPVAEAGASLTLSAGEPMFVLFGALAVRRGLGLTFAGEGHG